MKSKIKRKTLALVLAISMILMSLPISGIAVAGENNTAPFTNPFSQEVQFVVNGKTESSHSYRIPSMVTLTDGTIVAAADIRWNTTFDGGGLDTLVARSTDGGANWSYTVANYLGDNGNVYNGSHSTAFLDPSLVVAADGKTVYMLVDLYAYGVALNGDSSYIQPVADTGFDANGNLKLSNNNHSSYDYYLKDGKIYNSSNQVEDGYTVDPYFNITYTLAGEIKKSNLFFADSPFKVARTQYLYLTKSTDGGATWSKPNLLDVRVKAKVAATENALLVSPGNSITTSGGIMVYPVYSYKTDGTQHVALIYSTDGVNWMRSSDYTALNWSSEGSIVELQNGNLRVFVRNKTGYLCYVDFDMKTMSWIGHTQTTVPTNSNTQLSAITYSKTFNGQQVILVSCPTGPNEAGSNNNDGSCRTNGKIFMGVVAADRTMSWPKSIDVGPAKATSQLSGFPYTEEQGFFAYSCLTERSDGSIAILYENNQFRWGASGSNGDGTYDSEKVTTYYTITGKSFTADELGVYPDLDEMTKVILKEDVTQVTLYQNPADSSAGSVSVTADELDGVYLVDSWYIDETTGEKWYLLKDSASHSWPEEYDAYRYVPTSALEETDQGLAYPIVDFTNPAPIIGTSTVNPSVTPYAARRSMFASPAQAFALTRGVQKDATGLELSKTATDNGDGTYTITLEAYTTGTVTVTQTTKPLDIVLVLDQSGSMEWCINCGADSWYENSTCPKAPESYTPVSVADLNDDGEYYVKSGDTYTRVYYCDGGRRHNHEAGVFYNEHNYGSHSGVAVTEQIYEHTGGKHVRRVDALKEAVQAFVDEVYRKAAGADGEHGTDDDVAHRIAIVGFGSTPANSGSERYGNNTELLSIAGSNSTVSGTSAVGIRYNQITIDNYQSVLQNLGKDSYAASKTMLDNAIDALTASGATRADLGMKMAENIYKNNPVNQNERNRVTIMFTDGSPTSYSDFDDTVANSTISSANTQKNTYGATVYTIGVFDGANASNPTGDLPPYNAIDSNQENRYMYLVSSNYPNASDMDNTGDRNPNVTATQSYYMSASSTQALNKIFVAMSTQMGGTTSELDSTTVVKDIVAPSFVLPNGADKNITVTTKDAYYTDGVLDWNNEKPFAAGVTITGNTVDVTGFDYKHNFVAETGRVEGDATQSGNFHGRKLVITFVITPNPDFLGGSGVPTNGADSGVYDKDGVLQEDFTIPTVDVPLKPISNVVQNKYIYLGNTADLTGILDLYVTVMHEDQQKNLQIDVDGINNAYVDLKYTINLDDVNVAVYTIPAGKKWEDGTWTVNKGDLLRNYQALGDTKFEVTCVMTDAAESSKLTPDQYTANGTAAIFVYKPTVTFKDSVQKYNKTLNMGTDVNSFLNAHKVGVDWKHGETLSTQVAMEGDAPEITFEYAYADGVFNDFVMNSVNDVPVNVTATIQGTGTAIGNNEGVTYKHQNCGGGVNCKYGMGYEEFIVHVINALTSLTIEKTGAADIDVNQSFLFTVTGKDADGKDINLTVTVHGNGSTIIDGLVVGNEYTITEKTDWSWRYEFSKWEHKVNADDATTKTGSTNGAAIELGENGTITFTNERKEVKWLDGDSWCNNIFNRIIKMFK